MTISTSIGSATPDNARGEIMNRRKMLRGIFTATAAGVLAPASADRLLFELNKPVSIVAPTRNMTISDQTFRNTVLNIDGMRLERCILDNVELVGELAKMSHCSVKNLPGPIQMQHDSLMENSVIDCQGMGDGIVIKVNGDLTINSNLTLGDPNARLRDDFSFKHSESDGPQILNNYFRG